MADYLEVPTYIKWGQKDRNWLESMYEEANDSIQRTKENLLTLMVASPRDFKDELGNDITWEEHVQFLLNQEWDYLKEEIINRFLAGAAIENFEYLKSEEEQV